LVAIAWEGPTAGVVAEPPTASAAASWLAVSGMASLGAGAIHAAAIGVHAEHRQAAITFAVLALLQLAWGGVALVRSGRLGALAGVALNAGAVGGWVLAKTAGISFIDGLDVAEPIQLADALAAGLAFASALTAVVVLVPRLSGGQVRRPTAVLAVSGLAMSSLTMVGMVGAGTHVHSHGHGHGHDEGASTLAADGHSHSHGGAAPGGSEAAAAVPTHPYDPTKPLDFSGVPGVTPEQQAAAENLVAVTLLRLPKWSDPAVAEAAGFRSIGDGRTGVEHFVNQEFMSDDDMLDPDRPESLVFDTTGGGRRLVAAMYMAQKGLPLDQVPNIGGKLMQWHTHENLCYNAQGKVAGITDAAGNCPAGLVKPVPTPMIHVWIEPHRCGPFAALEGIGGGRIPDGETKLCDHVHGSA
jgi:hypothetical protein